LLTKPRSKEKTGRNLPHGTAERAVRDKDEGQGDQHQEDVVSPLIEILYLHAVFLGG